MSDYLMHPDDELSTFAAPALSGRGLTARYEECLGRDGMTVHERLGRLEVIASIAIARVKHLEDRGASSVAREWAAAEGS